MSPLPDRFPAVERFLTVLGRLTAVVASLTLALLVAELAARALSSPEPIRRVYDPFAYRIPQPGLVDTFESPFGQRVTVRLNERGMRGPSIEEAKRPGELRLVFLGGSATECYPLSREQTWPELAASELRRRLGVPVTVWNAGASAATSSISLARLQHQVLDLQPDLVVVMDGINDLLAGFHPRFRGDGRHLPRPPTADARPRSALLAQLRRATALEGSMPKAARGRQVEDSELRPSLDVFARNLRSMAALAEEHGFDLLLLTQPTMYRETPKPGEAARFRLQLDMQRLGVTPPDVPSLARAMAAFNAETLGLAARTRAHGFDLAAALPQDETLVYDECHFTPEGSRRVGKLVGEFLASRSREARALRLLQPQPASPSS